MMRRSSATTRAGGVGAACAVVLIRRVSYGSAAVPAGGEAFRGGRDGEWKHDSLGQTPDHRQASIKCPRRATETPASQPHQATDAICGFAVGERA